MLVYRVQHSTYPDGPYTGDRWEGRSDMKAEHNDDRHPAPSGDLALGCIDWHERCGTDSPQSLLDWFDGWWDALDAAGHVVVILEARRARVGKYGQVVYDISAADELDQLDIDTFVGLFAPQADLEPAQ